LIDARTLAVRDSVGGVTQPRYAASARDGRHAFVTDSAARQLLVLDLVRAAIVARVDVGGPARHLSYEPSGRVVWVSLGNKAARVAAVDVATVARPRVVRRFAAPFLAHDVGFAAGRVWVTAGAAHELVIYDGRGGAVRVAADAAPQHVTFAGRLAFVTSGESGTMRVHDARTGRLLRTSRVPVGSYNVQEAEGHVLSPSLDRGTLCVADRFGRVTRRIQVARSSHDACAVVTA